MGLLYDVLLRALNDILLVPLLPHGMLSVGIHGKLSRKIGQRFGPIKKRRHIALERQLNLERTGCLLVLTWVGTFNFLCHVELCQPGCTLKAKKSKIYDMGLKCTNT